MLEYNGPIKAPIKKGQEIARLKVLNKDELLKSIPLYSSEELSLIHI